MAIASYGNAAKSAIDVSIKNLTISVKNKVLVKDSDLKIAQGKRYALVGENGIGKSTLLSLLAKGDIPLPKNASAYMVAQELYRSDSCTCMEYVINADEKAAGLATEIEELEAKMEQDLNYDVMEEVLARYDKVHELLRSNHDAEARVSKILSGLGFTETKKKAKTVELSGGWLMRLSIARALFTEPLFMLLDEPTNHLDIKAVIWLEEYLKSWKNTLVVVTHDKQTLHQ